MTSAQARERSERLVAEIKRRLKLLGVKETHHFLAYWRITQTILERPTTTAAELIFWADILRGISPLHARLGRFTHCVAGVLVEEAVMMGDRDG